MSVAKMKDGKRWYVFVRYKDWTGQTKQHKKEGFERKADAKEYERTFLEQKTGSSDMSFQTLYTLYMEDCKTRLKPTTYNTKNAMFVKHILPYLGKLEAGKIGPADIRKWQNTLMDIKTKSDTYSPTYLKTINNQVSALFNYGVKFYGLKSNPCRQAGSMGKNHADTMQFWTVDEFNSFLAAISSSPTFVVMFSLLFWTGMRSGELLALTPADFDFDANTVSISKNYARLKQQDLILDPKTPKAKRVIHLSNNLSTMVQQYIPSLYGLQPEDRMFAPFNRQSLRSELIRGCKRSGVKVIRVHDLRHSHASLLIELGYSPLLIAERLGHENIETTLRTYSHLYPNKHSELATKLDTMQKCYDFATHKIL